MKKNKLSVNSQQRLDEILKKGTVALDNFYRRHGESDTGFSRKKIKIRQKINGHFDPGSKARVNYEE